ncbi:hypothetical protein C7B62_12770 [Pleurocapsa sp. CCALA 161]|uniref:hypothetical protein n=1 Tax=Pleurocapsa sp. CCALA 161 TaxID=2107688 RepID=UPI000D07B2C1|nr:hypothetical protein [Pleurocapsa sp. CCALA 161]PSB09560.1 hypothetical protein C7B62_12770 [Pleurocapsa sp. CCALA 161]
MFECERLVYLQLQKTGCTHIAQLLNDYIGGKQIQKHNSLPVNLIGEKYIIGSIRNPWDWYVSLWAFGCNSKGLFRKKLTSHNLNHLRCFPVKEKKVRSIKALFHEVNKPMSLWKKTYADVENPRLFRDWLHLIFDPMRKYDLTEGYGFSPISSFAGLLTYRYTCVHSNVLKLNKLFNNTDIISFDQLLEFDKQNNLLNGIIRNESLEQDLIQVLKDVGYKLTLEEQEEIISRKKINTSKHKPSSFYYDDETVNMVRSREQLIIDKYQYNPPE